MALIKLYLLFNDLNMSWSEWEIGIGNMTIYLDKIAVIEPGCYLHPRQDITAHRIKVLFMQL